MYVKQLELYLKHNKGYKIICFVLFLKLFGNG